MNNEKLLCCGLLAIAVITIVVLVILLVKCYNGDNYEHEHQHQHEHNNCGTCQGLSEKVCVDRPKLHSLYRDGILTETSNLIRSKEWPVTMPYDQWAATNGRETSRGWSKSFGDLEAYQGPGVQCSPVKCCQNPDWIYNQNTNKCENTPNPVGNVNAPLKNHNCVEEFGTGWTLNSNTGMCEYTTDKNPCDGGLKPKKINEKWYCVIDPPVDPCHFRGLSHGCCTQDSPGCRDPCIPGPL